MKKLLLAGAACACLPGVASAQDLAGFRAEARIGWETPTVSGDGEVYKIGSAVSVGGEVGFDFAAGDKVVLGPYATYEISNVELCDGTDCLEIDDNLGLGGRIGYAVTPGSMLYAKLGYARMKISATSGGVSGSESQGGIQGALGWEANFGKSFYGKIEANYGDYGGFYGINLQRRQLVAGLGVRF